MAVAEEVAVAAIMVAEVEAGIITAVPEADEGVALPTTPPRVLITAASASLPPSPGCHVP